MGLSSSRHRRSSDGGNISARKIKDSRPSTDAPATDRDFGKSQSMPTLDRERKGTMTTPSNGTSSEKKPAAVKASGSVRRSESAVKRNDSLAPKTR
ncbi:unnamed protein product, partial [Mesorhabditis spiculigera]